VRGVAGGIVPGAWQVPGVVDVPFDDLALIGVVRQALRCREPDAPALHGTDRSGIVMPAIDGDEVTDARPEGVGLRPSEGCLGLPFPELARLVEGALEGRADGTVGALPADDDEAVRGRQRHGLRAWLGDREVRLFLPC